MAIERLALATRKGALILKRNGADWRVVHEGFPGCHVAIVFLDRRSGHLFACISDGHFGTKLHRWAEFANSITVDSSDPQEVWKELTAPAYPEGSKLADGKDAVLKYPWAMAAGSKKQPGRVYFGSEPGGLFISDDDGDSFRLCEPLWNHPTRTDKDLPWMGGGLDNPAIHSIVVDPRDESCVRIGISVAGVFQTDDGGATWRPTNKGLKAEFLPQPDPEVGHDPHILVQCESHPDVLWQQNQCGIFKSDDGGANWLDVSETGDDRTAHFGFVIAVDPADGNTAWVVPAESDMVRAAVGRKLCVCRTTDGGRSWQAFSEGLPQQDCYDFVFRHCLIQNGDELIFGTACGSLYHSGNRGESWTTIAKDLPPVYTVIEV
ncbi:MAG: glycosyl hydrolase [Planctomycetota bacterium]